MTSFLVLFSAPHRPTHASYAMLYVVPRDARVLIGVRNPMLWPIWGFMCRYCNQPAIYGACPVGCGTCVEATTTTAAAAATTTTTAPPLVLQIRIGDVITGSTVTSGVDMVGGANSEHAYLMTISSPGMYSFDACDSSYVRQTSA